MSDASVSYRNARGFENGYRSSHFGRVLAAVPTPGKCIALRTSARLPRTTGLGFTTPTQSHNPHCMDLLPRPVWQ